VALSLFDSIFGSISITSPASVSVSVAVCVSMSTAVFGVSVADNTVDVCMCVRVWRVWRVSLHVGVGVRVIVDVSVIEIFLPLQCF